MICAFVGKIRNFNVIKLQGTRKNLFFSFIITNPLMLCREIVAACCQIRKNIQKQADRRMFFLVVVKSVVPDVTIRTSGFSIDKNATTS